MEQPFDALPYLLGEFGLRLSRPEAGAGSPAQAPVTVTYVVADLATASVALARSLGCQGRALDPAELPEAGLAQRFDLAGGCVIALEPGDDTDAEDFLLAHGEGVYRVAAGQPQAVFPAAAADQRPAKQVSPGRLTTTRVLYRWASTVRSLVHLS